MEQYCSWTCRERPFNPSPVTAESPDCIGWPEIQCFGSPMRLTMQYSSWTAMPLTPASCSLRQRSWRERTNDVRPALVTVLHCRPVELNNLECSKWPDDNDSKSSGRTRRPALLHYPDSHRRGGA